MGRPKRAAEGGFVYHVLNRAHARQTIFEKDGDYQYQGRFKSFPMQEDEHFLTV